jgi:hypothetical protein
MVCLYKHVSDNSNNRPIGKNHDGPVLQPTSCQPTDDERTTAVSRLAQWLNERRPTAGPTSTTTSEWYYRVGGRVTARA